MSEELLPCPFCGGDAEMDSRRAYRNIDSGQLEMAVAVYCLSCAADISICIPDVPTITTDEVRAMWNTRPAAEAQDVQAHIDAALESVARIVERRAEDRFNEYGTRESDTNACYYGGSKQELHQERDEEDEDIAKAIRSRIGTNPLADLQAKLAQAQARIAELERELEAAHKRYNDTREPRRRATMAETPIQHLLTEIRVLKERVTALENEPAVYVPPPVYGPPSRMEDKFDIELAELPQEIHDAFDTFLNLRKKKESDNG